MRGRFPDRELPGPAGSAEWQTLLSLNRAYLDLRQEWEAACAATAGLYVWAEGMDGYTESEPYRHHVAAIDAVAALAYDHQRRIGEVTWRYASAAVALGSAVMGAGRGPRGVDGRGGLPRRPPRLRRAPLGLWAGPSWCGAVGANSGAL